MEKDYLTGVLNRRGLYDWYESLPQDTILQFMFLDLDNFKMVNDTYGHNIGDELLIAVAKILNDCIEDAVCVRLGGDEFVVVVNGKIEREKVICAAEDIITKVQQKEGFSDIDTDVSASIGILLDENSKEPLNDILFKIDTAMYQAKSNGKSCYIIFNDIADKVYDEVLMEQRQAKALENGEFEIQYKPVINSQTSRLVLSDVKIVWNMQDGRKRYQREFIPLFEKNGFIRELNIWAFEIACSHIKKFHEIKCAKGKVGIRMSKLLLLENNLPDRLDAIMELYGIEKNEICIEVEEKVFSRGSTKILMGLQNLQQRGFSIAVINVGVEFSSLKFWDRLCLDYIMFDSSYLKEALSTSRGRLILKTLFTIGNDLNIRVIADGISEKEDVIFLGGCGCASVCGSYYSEELSISEYREFVSGRLVLERQKVEFKFIRDFHSTDERYKGSVIGKVQLRKGISSKWGSIYFPGGSAMRDVIQLPAVILAEPSYTIGMWLRPEAANSWSSALYARYSGGFMSYVPFEFAGNSVFRVSEDADLNGWHDIFSRQLQMDKWSFVCLTYDSGVSRYYINGRKCGYQADIPLLPTCKQILIGGDPFQQSYKGYMSALTFFDNAMSEDEIREWYQEFLVEEGFQGEEEKFWM